MRCLSNYSKALRMKAIREKILRRKQSHQKAKNMKYNERESLTKELEYAEAEAERV